MKFGGKLYLFSVPGIAKLVAILTGCGPVVLASLLLVYYKSNPRPPSYPWVIISEGERAKWEFAYLIIVAAACGGTVVNLVLYNLVRFLKYNAWTKRIDCLYLTFGGLIQAAVGFMMVGSALTSTKEEPLGLKYAAGFLGIATGIVYWGAASLVNRD